MRPVWSVLCIHSLIDKSSNNISLIEVVEQLNISKPSQEAKERPLRVSDSLQWVTLWARTNSKTPETENSRDIVISPTGETVVCRELGINLTDYERLRMKRIVGFSIFKQQGIYSFQVQQFVNDVWTTVSDVPLQINIGSQQGSSEPVQTTTKAPGRKTKLKTQISN